jgi:hypothetical protein
MKGSGPNWLREGAVVTVWAAAAVNVFLFTWKTAFGIYKFPPLEAVEGDITKPKGGFQPLTKGTPGHEGEKIKPAPKSKAEKESFLEKIAPPLA